MEGLGDIIRHRRREIGLSQERLSELVNKSQGFIGQIERGESHPTLDTLKDILNILSLDANTIFYDQTDADKKLYWELFHMLKKLKPETSKHIIQEIKLFYFNEISN